MSNTVQVLSQNVHNVFLQELGTQNFFEREGQPYCEEDYHKLFSPRCYYNPPQPQSASPPPGVDTARVLSWTSASQPWTKPSTLNTSSAQTVDISLVRLPDITCTC